MWKLNVIEIAAYVDTLQEGDVFFKLAVGNDSYCLELSQLQTISEVPQSCRIPNMIHKPIFIDLNGHVDIRRKYQALKMVSTLKHLT